MKITKIGHCCLRIDIGNTRILTDPGNFSDGQNTITDIDAVIITHEHADHCHIPSLQEIVKNNPSVEIYTNSSTGKLLANENIEYQTISEGSTLDIDGVSVQTWNCEHADIYEDITPVLNTALFIEGKLLYPGDAFFVPDIAVDTLALPAEGPWMKASEAIDYALEVKPKQAFPVHDARLDTSLGDGRYAHYARVLASHSILWHNLAEGGEVKV